MKFIIQIILTAIITYILSLFLPFWSAALGAFLVALLIRTSTGLSFLAGFLGIALLWTTTVLLMGNISENILLTRVSQIFTIDNLLLVFLVTLLGGLLGGFAAATGSQLSHILMPQKKSSNPYRY